MDATGLLIDLGINPIRQQGNEILAHCPMHTLRTGAPDRHPSWYYNTDRHVFLCFSCQYAGTLIDLYRDLELTPPDDLEMELATTSAVAKARKIQHVSIEVAREPDPNVNEWTLHHYAEVPQRLLDLKHLTREAVDFFEVRWDRERKMWVLPIRTIDGTLIGYQFRAKGVEINYPKEVAKSSTLFGIAQQQDERRICLVESPLDAVRMYGIAPTIAAMGAYVSDEQLRLIAGYFNIVVVALDNDKVGRQATQVVCSKLWRRGSAAFAFNYTGVSGKDPGDEPDDDVLRTAYKASFIRNIAALTP